MSLRKNVTAYVEVKVYIRPFWTSKLHGVRDNFMPSHFNHGRLRYPLNNKLGEAHSRSGSINPL